MKKALFLLIFYISSLLPNDSEQQLFVNDYPIWSEFPEQIIDEDCINGCIDGIFNFDLEPYIDDPDGDIITILDPNLISGQIQE